MIWRRKAREVDVDGRLVDVSSDACTRPVLATRLETRRILMRNVSSAFGR